MKKYILVACINSCVLFGMQNTDLSSHNLDLSNLDKSIKDVQFWVNKNDLYFGVVCFDKRIFTVIKDWRNEQRKREFWGHMVTAPKDGSAYSQEISNIFAEMLYKAIRTHVADGRLPINVLYLNDKTNAPGIISKKETHILKTIEKP